MKPQLVAHDDLDTRREMVNLLACLPPQVRLAWIVDCCRRSNSPAGNGVRPKVQQDTYDLAEQARWDDSADARLTQDIFQGLIFLSVQYKFDLDAALKRLVPLARKYGKRLSWSVN